MACDRPIVRPVSRQRRRVGAAWVMAAVLSVTVAGLGRAPLARAADPAGPPPHPASGEARKHDESRRDGDGPRGGGGMGRRQMQPTPEEWTTVERFAEEHTPNRLKYLRKQDPASQEFRWTQGYLVGRYRSLENTRENDPGLYDQRLQTLQVEDRIFGQVEDGAAAPDAPPEKKQALRDDLAKWVTLNLQEREQRIERMATMLDEQRQKLEEDRNDQEGLVNRKMADVEREGIKGLLPDFVRRNRGDRPPRPPEEGDRPPQPNGHRPGPPPSPEPMPPMP